VARKKIGEILIAEGVLDETRLRAALIEQQRWGGPLGRLLVDMKLVDEATLVAALSRQLAIPSVDLDAQDIPQDVIALVPGELCDQQSVIPFARPMGKFLDLAMADPTNAGIVDELQIRTRLNVRPHLAGPKQIERAIAKYYGRGIGVAMRKGAAGGHGASIELESGPRSEKMEIVRPGRDTGIPVGEAAHSQPQVPPPGRDAEIEALQQRVSRLEALVARDEQVLRKVLALLVDKDIATRDEILERLK
jgi:type IV pilus assembly protein PilB